MASNRQEDLWKSGINLEGDTLLERLAFNSQCFLIQNMFNISQRVKMCYETMRHPFDEDKESQIPLQGHKSSNSTFKAVIPIVSDTDIRAEESFTVMARTAKEENLLDLTPAQQALLVPRITLYKVVYGEKEDPNQKGRMVPDIENTTDIRINFNTDIRTTDLEDIYKDARGRIPANGIQHFNWDLRGVNPAEVDANITANLKIYFNKVSNVSSLAGTKQMQGVNPTALTNPNTHASFFDLITWSPSNRIIPEDGSAITGGGPSPKTSPSHLRYDGRFFELKAVVGWAVPPRSADLFSPGEVEAIRKQQKVLYLQLKRHTFNFNQDGTAVLAIDYQARYTYRHEDCDILRVNTGSIEKELLKVQEKARNAGDTGSRDRYEEEAGKIQSELDKERKDRYSRLLEDILAKDKLYIAWATNASLRIFEQDNNDNILGASARAVQEMVEGTAVGGSVSNSEISVMSPSESENLYRVVLKSGPTATKESFWKPPMITALNLDRGARLGLDKYVEAALEPEGTDDLDSQKIHEISGYDNWRSETRNEFKPGCDNLSSATQGAYGVPLQNGRGGSTYTDAQTIRTSGHSVASRAKQGLTPVHFICFGDIVDSIVQATPGLSHEVMSGRLGFLFTDLQHYDIKKFYDLADQLAEGTSASGDLTYKPSPGERANRAVILTDLSTRQYTMKVEDRDNIMKTINLASIPIGFDNFVNFYINKVVKQRLGKLYFEDFLMDIVRELLMPVLSDKCFWGLPQRKIIVSYVNMLMDAGGDFHLEAYPYFKGRAQGTAGAEAWHTGQSPPFPVPDQGSTLASEAQQADWDLKYVPTNCRAFLLSKIIKKKPADLSALFRSTHAGNLAALYTGALLPADVSTTKNSKHVNFKVLSIMNHDLSYRTGNRAKDESVGIYHFSVGQKAGLVKEVQFRRSDIPYLREGRIDRTNTIGLDQLRELYSVTVRCYGTTLFKPGQYIYVNPSPIGFGDPKNARSFSRALGIGGYHLVTSVNSVIKPNSFETIVSALHEALPYVRED